MYNSGVERSLFVSNIEKVLNQNPDTIIILGSGLHTSKVNIKGKTSTDERMRIYAGLELYDRMINGGYNNPSFIFCGGHIYKNFPSLSSVAKELVSGIIVDSNTNFYAVNGNSTLSDIDLAINCMETNGLSRGVVISNEYHRVSKFYASRKGLMFLPAEGMLKIRDRRYKKIVDDLRKTEYYKNSNILQIALSLIISLPFGLGHKAYLKIGDKSERVAEENDPYKLQNMTGTLK
jgi:hypothetical protein